MLKLNRPWRRKTSILSGKNLDQIFCLGNIIGQSPWIRNQAKFGPQTHGGPLGAPGGSKPPMPTFWGKCLFFFLLPINWLLRNNPNESKKQKNWTFFLSVMPKKRPKWFRATNGQPQAQFWVFVFFLVPNLPFCHDDQPWLWRRPYLVLFQTVSALP